MAEARSVAAIPAAVPGVSPDGIVDVGRDGLRLVGASAVAIEEERWSSWVSDLLTHFCG